MDIDKGLDEEKRKILGKLLYNSVEAWQKQFTEISKQIHLNMKSFKMPKLSTEQIEAIHNLEKSYKKLKRSKYKWILHEDLPIPFLYDLYDPNNKKFNNFITEEQVAKEYLTILCENKYINPYSKILEKAFQAHIKKDYIVSIPLLFIAIDGTFYTYGVKKKYVKNGKIKSNSNWANLNTMSKQLYHLFSKEFLDFIDNKTVKSKKTKHGQV